MLDEVEKAVVGKREALTLVLAAILAKGHVLLEDFPGLGKTLAARSFAQALGLDFARAQFTPDLLPADLTGSFLYDQRAGTFEFRRGPLFTGLLLADEINRTPPKTQAALLEAMQERQVTVEGETFPLPEPFHVLATANPIEYEGTYPLPEAQLDRFLLRVSFGYPTANEEYDVLARRVARRQEEIVLDQVTDAAGLLAMQAAVETVTVDESVGRYCVDLAAATREHARRAHRRLAARLARAGAGGARLRGAAGPRLRHPRGRQGGGPLGAGPPDHGQARALDDRGQRLPGRRAGARLGADAGDPGGAPPVMNALAGHRLAGPGGGGRRARARARGAASATRWSSCWWRRSCCWRALGLVHRPDLDPAHRRPARPRLPPRGPGHPARGCSSTTSTGVEHVTRIAVPVPYVAMHPSHGRLGGLVAERRRPAGAWR